MLFENFVTDHAPVAKTNKNKQTNKPKNKTKTKKKDKEKLKKKKKTSNDVCNFCTSRALCRGITCLVEKLVRTVDVPDLAVLRFLVVFRQ